MTASHHSPESRRDTPSAPLRESDVDRATAITVRRLRDRGVEVSGSETSQQLVRLVTAVEDFERAVERRGGDTFVNTPRSSEPERAEWVVPARASDEATDAYIRRVEAAVERVERGDALPDELTSEK